MRVNGKDFGNHIVYIAHHYSLDLEAWFEVYRGKVVDCAPGKEQFKGERWAVVKNKIKETGFVIIKIIGGKEF